MVTDWEKVKDYYIGIGYVCDFEDEERLGFSKYIDEEHEWMIDYSKKTGASTHMNGRQVVNFSQGNK